MDKDFCGLTEREVNEKLCERLAELADWPLSFEETCLWLKIGDVRGKRIQLFTHSLDSCRLLESRLSDEQMETYGRWLVNWNGYIEVPAHRHEALIMLDAPTRVRALLQVLNLAPMTRDEEAINYEQNEIN